MAISAVVGAPHLLRWLAHVGLLEGLTRIESTSEPHSLLNPNEMAGD